jgi:hypothetical protein
MNQRASRLPEQPSTNGASAALREFGAHMRKRSKASHWHRAGASRHL